MSVTLNLFGQLRHIADADEVSIDVATDSTLLSTLKALAGNYDDSFSTMLFDESGAVRPTMMVLINETTIDKANPPSIQDGDQITLLSAIAGG